MGLDDCPRLPRSYLYTPGHRREMIAKALRSDADVVVVDLEDSVPAHAKDQARHNVVSAARSCAATDRKRLHVRINALITSEGEDDLRAIARHTETTNVWLPKVRGPEDARVASDLAGRPVTLTCLLESALAVERAYEIATTSGVAALGLGEADLRADLGVAVDASDEGLKYARSRIIVASRAAGLRPPAQSVEPHVDDLGQLALTTRRGRAVGFFGRTAIHLAQVPVINEASMPTASEIATAQAVVAAELDEHGGVVLDGGRYVDAAVRAAARRVLAWSGGGARR